jgi:quercetin dioxygenase-like cupin family protein
MGLEARKPTTKGPAEWFTGEVWIDPIVVPSGQSQLSIAAVHFTPGARTAWHRHEGGQTLYVIEGAGLVQSRGEETAEIRPGDVHVTADGQEHWHGATHDRFMTHLSITQGAATWGEHVTDAEYGRDVSVPAGARIVPPRARSARQPGFWAGRVRLGADFDELPDDVAAAFRGDKP